MATELYTNNASTTLSAAISSSGATSITVTSSSGFPVPASGVSQFRVLIDSEILIVTAISGTTWTVTRGAEGTTAATHSNGAAVTHIVTAAEMAQPAANGLTPDQVGLLAWNAPPHVVGSSSSNLGVSGRQGFSRLWIPPGLITNVIVAVRTAGATLTASQSEAALFDASGTLLSRTADQSTAWTTTGLKVMALAAPQTSTGAFYYIGRISVGTTQPIFSIIPGDSSAGIMGGLNGSGSRLGYLDATTRTALLSSYTLTGLSADGSTIAWVAVS